MLITDFLSWRMLFSIHGLPTGLSLEWLGRTAEERDACLVYVGNSTWGPDSGHQINSQDTVTRSSVRVHAAWERAKESKIQAVLVVDYSSDVTVTCRTHLPHAIRRNTPQERIMSH